MKHDVEEMEDATTITGRRRFEDNSTRKTGGAEQEEIRRKMEAAAKPGPSHKALDALVGDWQAEVKCWAEPGGSPEVSEATAKTRWTLDGHFVEEEFHGKMMGRSFTGRSLLGYDNTKQTYNSVWVSDMQTSMFTCEGKGENGNKVITLEGTTNCPGTGQKNIPMKTVYRVLGPDKHLFEMYDGSKGNKTMEITYTRR